MARLRAAFDCDGVLLDADEIFRDHFECQGYQVVETGKFTYSLSPDPGEQKIAEMIDDCVDRRTVDMDVHEGVEELVKRLFDDTGDVARIITARSERHASQTAMAMRRVFGSAPFSLSFTSGRGKADYLKGLCVMVEDRRRTAISLASQGMVVVCPKRSWNWPIGVPRFEPGRGWTWMEETDLNDYGLTPKEYPPYLFWTGRIIYAESMESLLKNDRLYQVLLDR